jgi:hypothetical protein
MLAKSLIAFLVLATALTAEVATRATPVHLRPDSGSPVLRLIKPGETLPEVVSGHSAASGWTTVALPGPHDVFVENRYIGKDLDVEPGAPLHLGAKTSTPVLTQSTVDDVVTITGLRGRWTQLELDQPVTGYIFGAEPAGVLRTEPEIPTATLQDDASSVGPSTPTSSKPTIGKAIERTAAERESLAALPRLFEGVLTSTRSPLRPRRPYDFALQTDSGTRFAYVDLKKILLNTPVENYMRHQVVVYGTARPIPDTKDIVITVESMQLR